MEHVPALTGRPSFESYLAEGARRGLLWTELRAGVLHLLWSDGVPWGAYDAADRLQTGPKRVHSTSVYRCLEHLQRAGLVLPVVSWKRFLVSPDPAVRHWGLLLCSECRSCTAVDMSGHVEAWSRSISGPQFVPATYTIECAGLCSNCHGGSTVQ